MKKVLTIILILTAIGCGLWMSQGWTQKRVDDKVAKFNLVCDNLIMGIQQYREFVGSYPMGNNSSIAKALLGQTDKKVLILAIRRADLNDKGEVVDPWGSPLRFYFSNDEVLLRSAGPNKVWEDSANASSDDLYRCASKEKP